MKWLLLWVFLIPIHAYSYPYFIRHEYTSCTSCHLSPQGGGLLTDYGTGVAGSSSVFQEDYQGQPKNKFYKIFSANGKINHGFQQRLMLLKKKNKSPAFFPMQIDYLNSTQLSEKLRFDFTFGADVRRDSSGSARFSGSLFDKTTLRKSILAYSFTEQSELDLGRDYLPIGLNLDDHTAFVRTKNRRSVTDYPTQLRLQLWDDFNFHTPFVFLPSYEEGYPNREWGVGYRGEHYFNNKTTLGVSTLFGRSPTIQRELIGLFSRTNPISKLVVMAEYDFTGRQRLEPDSSTGFTQHVVYTRTSYEPLDWLEAGWVMEYSWRQAPFNDRTLKFGPNIYTRVIRQITLIFDIRSTRSVDQNELTITWQLFGHV